MKKLLCLALAWIMSMSIVGCSSGNTSVKETTEMSTSQTVEATTDAEEELSNIEMMEKYVGKFVDMSQYELKEDDSNEFCKNYNYTDMIQVSMTDTVTFNDGTAVTLLNSTVNSIVASGYSVKEVNNDDFGYRSLIVLEKNGDEISVDVSASEKDIYSAFVKGINLTTEGNCAGYDYCGITNDATMETVVKLLGSPNDGIIFSCDKNGENCTICFSYYSETNDIYPNVNFTYDPETKQVNYHSTYISAV